MTESQLGGAIREWDRGAWCLAALAISLRTDQGGALARAAHDVLAAVDLDGAPGAQLSFSTEQLIGMAASPLLQTAALVGGSDTEWAAQSEPILLAQGRASGAAGAMFAQFALPQLGDLANRLSAPGARMLDVGTGVGALATGFAETFPHLSVTGIDVLPRVLEIARGVVAGSPAADRVSLRRQDVAELDEPDSYDLAWLPAPFVPPTSLAAGAARVLRALRPGGVVLLGHGKFDGAPLDEALTRFKTAVYGGTALDGPAACRLLGNAGFSDVGTMRTPPGAPAITVGRRAG